MNGNDITITEMNDGSGATAANGYRTTGFHEFDTCTVKAVPGISYILFPEVPHREGRLQSSD